MLDRLDELEANAATDGQSKVAITALTSRSYTPAERDRLRSLLAKTKGYADAVTSGERDQLLGQLYAFHHLPPPSTTSGRPSPGRSSPSGSTSSPWAWRRSASRRRPPRRSPPSLTARRAPRARRARPPRPGRPSPPPRPGRPARRPDPPRPNLAERHRAFAKRLAGLAGRSPTLAGPPGDLGRAARQPGSRFPEVAARPPLGLPAGAGGEFPGDFALPGGARSPPRRVAGS
jgi:hypothetical protein